MFVWLLAWQLKLAVGLEVEAVAGLELTGSAASLEVEAVAGSTTACPTVGSTACVLDCCMLRWFDSC